MYVEHLCHSESLWRLRGRRGLTLVALLIDGLSYNITAGVGTQLLDDRTHETLGSAPETSRIVNACDFNLQLIKVGRLDGSSKSSSAT